MKYKYYIVANTYICKVLNEDEFFLYKTIYDKKYTPTVTTFSEYKQEVETRKMNEIDYILFGIDITNDK